MVNAVYILCLLSSLHCTLYLFPCTAHSDLPKQCTLPQWYTLPQHCTILLNCTPHPSPTLHSSPTLYSSSALQPSPALLCFPTLQPSHALHPLSTLHPSLHSTIPHNYTALETPQHSNFTQRSTLPLTTTGRLLGLFSSPPMLWDGARCGTPQRVKGLDVFPPYKRSESFLWWDLFSNCNYLFMLLIAYKT